MPYHTNKDLPEPVRSHLPPHAQDIYREAYNHAHEQYGHEPHKKRDPQESLEEVCSRIAWSAVKQKYEKGEDGKWHPK